MNYLFKIETDPVPDEVKVSDTNFKKFYQQVNDNMSWDIFENDIRRVTRDIIEPAITMEFYVYLSNAYQTDEGTLTNAEKHVLEILQDTIAFYTVWKMSPRHNVTIGNLGIQENNGTEGSSSAASQWRYKNFHWNIMKEADSMLDIALSYLEKNQSEFADFQSNKAKLIINDSYVRHTEDYQEFIFLHDSRRTFSKLIPSIRKAQRKNIEPILGSEYHTELLAESQGDTLTVANKKVVKLIQEYQAHQSLHYALPHLAVVIEGDGIKVVTSTDGMNSKQTAHESRLEALKQQNERDTQEAKMALLDFLYCNEDDYPTWKNSDAYNNYNQDDLGYPMTFEGGGGILLD